MNILMGRPISPGYGSGRAYLHERERDADRQAPATVADSAHEACRFSEALVRAKEELTEIKSRVASNVGGKDADLLDAHLALLGDPEFANRIRERISFEALTAEEAIKRTVGEIAEALKSADDPYLRERAQDIQELGRWVVRQLSIQGSALLAIPPQSVLVAKEFLPLDLLRIDRQNVAAIVTEQGSQTSHTAILARSMGVPYVVGVTDATQVLKSGMQLLVDGHTGEVLIDPEAIGAGPFLRSKNTYDKETAYSIAAENRACVTLDGVAIELYANIGHPMEAIGVLDHCLEGVGLFRTEYMFLAQAEPPSLQLQRVAYKSVVETLSARPLVIRTLDFGGDKIPAFVGPPFEMNPSLGVRGLRYSLTAAIDLFRVQLKAIVQAKGDAELGILFPMVLGSHDLRRAIAVLDEICREEVTTTGRPKIGAMIETPSAVFMIDEIPLVVKKDVTFFKQPFFEERCLLAPG